MATEGHVKFTITDTQRKERDGRDRQVGKRGKYGKNKNKVGASALKHVVDLLVYKTRISPLK